MKKTSIRLTFLIAICGIAVSCNNGKKGNTAGVETASDTAMSQASAPTEASGTSSFDIDRIPISDKELGTFPFFSLPTDMKEQNKAINRKYDMLFFPIDGKMTRLEGKVWKSSIVPASDNYDDWSLPYFQKSYDEAITSVGGVKIFDGKVSQQELDRIKSEAGYFGEEGSIDYWNEPVRTYIIRRKNGDDVYIQLSGNTAGGEVQILQKEAFKQTITMLRSEEISKQLNEKGKAILHINFDTDKASLKPDGKETVKEIVKALEADPSLKIAINGYTDNSGSPEHNKTLSEARAQTVKDEIAKAGIEIKRINSKGFGQENPISDNTSEEGKAQNRRVELVKI